MTMRVVVAALLVVILAIPVWAGDTSPSEVEEFDFNQPFDEARDRQILRSLLERAVDAVVDHIEVRGRLKKDQQGTEREGRFELRLYPEGKSRSKDHVGAEGWFRWSPDTGNELTLRFKSFREPTEPTPHDPADYL